MKENKKQKKIILKPLSKPNTSKENTLKFIDKVKDKIDLLYINPSEYFEYIQNDLNLRIIYPSDKANYVVLDNAEELENLSLNYLKSIGNNNKDNETELITPNIRERENKNRTFIKKQFGVYKQVKSNKDVEEIKTISEKGANFVIIDVEDWKIIPLENIIATLQGTDTEIFALAKSIEEIETLFTVLELGVDGIIFESNDEDEVSKIQHIIRKFAFNIAPAKILEIKDIGIGERVCIDTVSMLCEGEGMLIGNKSNFLFLVHNESVGSSFTSPRPFRVNAGAVHSYTITPDGTTKYLSELESGNQILIVNARGMARIVSVGRAKIESRPLRLFKAICGSEIGTIIVQNAETIRFLDKNHKILPVTHTKIGDEIMVFSKRPSGRHFGMEIPDEYILEK
ncbi:MAG: 3-dehydroquinate synthase II [Thermoproteota archaeon]|nr:3-dehydroquinate synthase II [Thermoproteota archaeon]